MSPAFIVFRQANPLNSHLFRQHAQEVKFILSCSVLICFDMEMCIISSLPLSLEIDCFESPNLFEDAYRGNKVTIFPKI